MASPGFACSIQDQVHPLAPCLQRSDITHPGSHLGISITDMRLVSKADNTKPYVFIRQPDSIIYKMSSLIVTPWFKISIANLNKYLDNNFFFFDHLNVSTLIFLVVNKN